MWVGDLRSREFIGTESRLNTIFDLLRQMVFGAEDDPERRLAELRRRRAEIDEEIARAERGEIVRLDAVSQRDRYQQFSRTARELLADFRQVEENFRRLDRSLREQIAGWTGSKGALLDDALGSRNSIAESDQGRSFQAFYDFLLSHQRQAELTDLLERLQEIEEIGEEDERLAPHPLRLDRRLRADPGDGPAALRAAAPVPRRPGLAGEPAGVRPPAQHRGQGAGRAGHPASRPSRWRWTTPASPSDCRWSGPCTGARPRCTLESAAVAAGSDEFDSSALVSQMYIDRARLAGSVWEALGPQEQVGLRTVLADAPLEQGLAELIGYLSLAEPGLAVVFDEEHREQVAWSPEDEEVERVADLPRVSFTRDRTCEAR